MRSLVAGADFGTDSVRVVVIDALTGEKAATAVAYYPRWQKQMYCDAAANQFRQHPLDYIESFTECMREAIARTGARKGDLCAIAVDTTGSTPCPVDRSCTPLAMLDGFRDDPDAMFHLWKDHTAVEEAKEINHVFPLLKWTIPCTRASIRLNGTGPKYCAQSGTMKGSGWRHGPGWNTVTGCRLS